MADGETDGSPNPVREIEDEAAFEEMLANESRVLIDFYADWCGPCNLMESVVAELAAESDDTVAKVDVEALPHVAARYDVQSIPTFLLFSDDAVDERLIGMQNKEELGALLG